MSIISCFPGGAPAKIPVIAAASVAALPTAAKEGTIALITSTALGTAYIGNMTVATPVAGDVRIRTSALAPHPIAPLRGQPVEIYPQSAAQYSGTEWTDVALYVRHNGVWAQQTVWLYNAGELYATVTGGWSMGYQGNGSTSITLESERIRVACNGQSVWIAVATNNAVDMTPFSTLTVNFTQSGNNDYSNNRLYLMTSHDASPNTETPYAEFSGRYTNKIMTLDVSAVTGEWYIGMGTNNYGTLYLNSLKAE